MGRQPCCDKFGLKRGPWTVEGDHKLVCFILNNGIRCWRMVPKLEGLLRCGKSCRLRWINYLRPDLKRGAFSEMEEDEIIELHSRLGNRWSQIASHFPERTDNEIKNHWNTRIKERLKLQGLDPVTHMPLEPKEHVEENIGSNVQNKRGLAIDTISEQGNAKIAQDSSQANDKRETNYLTNNFDHLMSKNLDTDSWMMSEHMTSLNSSCYSTSLEEFVSYANPAEKSTISDHDEYYDAELVESVDSVMCWDGFNQLDQQFFLKFSARGQ